MHWRICEWADRYCREVLLQYPGITALSLAISRSQVGSYRKMSQSESVLSMLTYGMITEISCDLKASNCMIAVKMPHIWAGFVGIEHEIRMSLGMILGMANKILW